MTTKKHQCQYTIFISRDQIGKSRQYIEGDVKSTSTRFNGGRWRSGVCDGLAELIDIIRSLKSNEALCLGVPNCVRQGIFEGGVLSLKTMARWLDGAIEPGQKGYTEAGVRARLTAAGGWIMGGDGVAYICRTLECMHEGNTLLMDVDSTEALNLNELDARIAAQYPPMANVERAWITSSGSKMTVGDKLVSGLKAHGFIGVEGSIARIGPHLAAHCPVDPSVYSPERLIYSGLGAYEPPLCAGPVETLVIAGAPLMRVELPPEPERAERRIRVEGLTDPITEARLRRQYEALAAKWLPFVATLQGGGDEHVWRAICALVPYVGAGVADEATLRGEMETACDECGYEKFAYDWDRAMDKYADDDVSGPTPEDLMPEAQEPAMVVALESITDPMEMADRLARMDPFDYLPRLDALIAGMGVGRQAMKARIKLIRDGLARQSAAAVVAASPAPLLDKEDPRQSAVAFKAQFYQNMVRISEEFLDWQEGAYVVIPENMVHSRVAKFLDAAMIQAVNQETGQMELQRFKPKSDDINQVMVALRDLCETQKSFPAWLDDSTVDVSQIISFPNGWLDTRTMEFHDPNPALLTRCALEFDYDPYCPEPELFFATTRQWWPDLEVWKQSMYLLQRYIGMLLIQDTSYQKIGMLIGASRSGKSEFARLLGKLVGVVNTASCSSRAMSKGDFVFDGFRGKSLVVFPDMRVKSDIADDLLEKLLNISGEDILGINRKGKSYLYERLSCRLLIVCNLFPDFKDATGALAARIIPFKFDQSFAGREDRTLGARLEVELPGIINWGLEGLRLLRAEGGFTLNARAQATIDNVRRQGAPLADFIEDTLELRPTGRVDKDELYALYLASQAFASLPGQSGDRPMNKVHFSRQLHATIAGLDVVRYTHDVSKKRVHAFTGIALKRT